MKARELAAKLLETPELEVKLAIDPEGNGFFDVDDIGYQLFDELGECIADFDPKHPPDIADGDRYLVIWP